jgi:hypothetical protein
MELRQIYGEIEDKESRLNYLPINININTLYGD